RRDVAPRGGEPGKTMLESSCDLSKRQNCDAGCGKLDREGVTFGLRDDGTHECGIGLARKSARARPIYKQVRRALVFEWLEVVNEFRIELESLARGHHNPQPGCSLNKPPDDDGRVIDKLLEVVQDEQPSPETTEPFRQVPQTLVR